MIARCQKCRNPFDAQGDWQKLCWDCWRARDRERSSTGDLGAIERRAAKAVTEAYAAGRARGYEEGWAVGRAEARPSGNGHGSALSPGLHRELIRLCHPDLHPPERFDLANRVTQELNSMRHA